MPFLKNALHRGYKKIEIKSHQLLYLFLEITRRCNLNCLHCGSDCKSSIGQAELTTESWLKIIDYMSEHFSPQLSFVITGGEPLTHPDLFRIGEQIQSKGRRWGMVSNGLALDAHAFERLISAGIYSLTLSLDGTETAHNKLRNHPKAFTRVSSALKRIGQSDIPFKDVVTCVYPGNIDELERVAELLIEYGIRYWRLFRIFPSGRAKDNDELLLSFEDTQRMLNWIAENRDSYRARGLELSYSCEGYLPMDLDLKVRDMPFFCRAGINVASILSDGTITGCTNNDSYFHEGNILRDNFARLWEKGFRKFRDRSWAREGICADCPHFKDCQGSSIHLWHEPSDGIAFCYLKGRQS